MPTPDTYERPSYTAIPYGIPRADADGKIASGYVPSSAPGAHASSHQNNGSDEISVAGLSGVLADPQTPATHASSHASGGGDALKLDDLAATDDNTDLDASTSKHGLMKKYPGGTTTFLRADGSFAAPPGGPGGEAFPVGSVFLSVVSTDPATLLGYGTWEAIGAGRVLVGQDAGDADFDTLEETGGAKTVAAAGSNAAEAAHTHTYTEVPNHVHVQTLPSTQAGNFACGTRDASSGGTGGSPGTIADTLSTANPTGGVATGTTSAGSSHNHAFTGSATSVVQPYLVVKMWKRTA